MAASSISGSLGDDEAEASVQSVDAPKKQKVHDKNNRSDVKNNDEPLVPLVPQDESLLATPRTSPSKRNSCVSKADTSYESAMNYSPSPTSEPERKSTNSSPIQLTLNQPIVSHVPASVQPALHSEQSSLASLPQHQVDVERSTQQQQPHQQQPQHQVSEEKLSVVPMLVIHGTQGQVVTKRKGRFRLLQDSDAPATNLGGEAHATMPQSTEQVATIGTGMEGVTSGAHPTRERALSNTSTISAMSVPSAAPTVIPNAPIAVDSPIHAHAGPVGKKKGRFVVIPADVTDSSLLRQPFPGNHRVLIQQALQPAIADVSEQVIMHTPQAPAMVVPQAAVVVTQQPIMSQDVTPQVQSVESQLQQHQNVPHNQVQQVPQYYATASQIPVGIAPQVVQVSYQQQQQHQVGPPVAPAQMQRRTSHSPVPPSAQQPQQVHQQNAHPPAQILVSEQPINQPAYFVQTDDGRFHQMVAGPQQHTASIPEQQSAVSGLQTAVSSYDAQHQVQTISGATPVLPTVETALKPLQVVKPTVKRPGMQRGPSGIKGGQANVGFGKVFYFLEQMKLEVTEADRTIKSQARDMKFLVGFALLY
jgi:hypothetical protein